MRQIVGFGDRSTGMGTFGANLGRAIVTKGARAYMCYSAATRSSSQITLGKLVIITSTRVGKHLQVTKFNFFIWKNKTRTKKTLPQKDSLWKYHKEYNVDVLMWDACLGCLSRIFYSRTFHILCIDTDFVLI